MSGFSICTHIKRCFSAAGGKINQDKESISEASVHLSLDMNAQPSYQKYCVINDQCHSLLQGTKANIRDPSDENSLGPQHIYHLNSTVYKDLKGRKRTIQPGNTRKNPRSCSSFYI